MEMKVTVLLAALVLALVLAGSATAGTVTLFDNIDVASSSNPAPAGSSNLGPLGSVGGIGGPISFTMPMAGVFTLTVNDLFLVGDVYQAFIDGVSQGFTSTVELGGPTNSTGSFTEYLSAGPHTYDINDVVLSYVGSADPYGGGDVTAEYSPAHVEDIGVLSPEPGTFVLLGIGLLGAAGIRRRQKV